MGEDTGKVKQTEQKQEAELTAEDLEQVAGGGITVTHSPTPLTHSPTTGGAVVAGIKTNFDQGLP